MVSNIYLLSYLQETHVIHVRPCTYSVKQGHGSDVVHEIIPVRLKSFSFHIKHEKCDVIRDCVMCRGRWWQTDWFIESADLLVILPTHTQQISHRIVQKKQKHPASDGYMKLCGWK